MVLGNMCHGAGGPLSLPSRPRDHARLKRLVMYVQSRLGAPLSLEDLARAANLSARGVNLLCQRHYQLSPMELLREFRLEAVRARLLADPELPIGEIAMLHGFGHLGRFSQYYKARFGVLPTETRAQAALARCPAHPLAGMHHPGHPQEPPHGEQHP